jgi:hypothetical protein
MRRNAWAVRLQLALLAGGLVLAAGCGGESDTAAPTTTTTAQAPETQAETETEAEQTPAQAVCAKLTVEQLAAAPDRVAYLRDLLPQAEEAGMGLAPLIRLSVRAIQANDVEAAAHNLQLLADACERAG